MGFPQDVPTRLTQVCFAWLVAWATGHAVLPAAPPASDDGVEMPLEIAQDTGLELAEPN